MEPRKRHPMKTIVISLALLGVFVAAEASAIIGMPMTPVSFAGAARRTVRRAYY